MKKTLLLLSMLFTISIVSAQFTVGNTTYTVTDATNLYVEVTKNITDTAVLIPGKVTDAGGTGLEYTVVAIGANAFNPGTNPGGVMTTIELPASVKEIKTQAFRSSLLQSIKFTTVNGLEKIQASAFRIAAAVTSIDNVLASTAPTLTIYGGAVFQQMNIASVVFPSNTIIFDATALNLFNASTLLTSVNLSGTTLTAIPAQMFRSTGITTMNFSGTTITSVGVSAFQACTALKTVNLGNVNNVGNSCFIGCTGLTELQTNLETVPTTGTTIFSGLTDTFLATVKLYVPTEAAKTAFKADAQWGKLDVVVGAILSTNNLEKELDFSLYPNPTSDIVLIKSKELNNANVSVYDLNGRVLLNKNISGTSSEINISDLASGIYLFKVQADGATFTKRIVKK